MDRIGNHISKGKNLSSSIEKYITDCETTKPCQVFLRSPTSGRGNVSDKVLSSCLSVVNKHNAKVFVHAAYIINLCSPFTRKNPSSDEWILSLLKSDLDISNKAGFKGVVVHVGKRKNIPLSDALNKMEESIRKVLDNASEDSPLIIETPAGQGTEVCTTIEEFSQFYQRFNGDSRVKVCIDTCHVFASGYNPLKYIKRWNELHPSSIQLVHFNDSKEKKGSRKDRHALCGKGYIGINKMSKVADFCNENNIPMVIE